MYKSQAAVDPKCLYHVYAHSEAHFTPVRQSAILFGLSDCADLFLLVDLSLSHQ